MKPKTSYAARSRCNRSRGLVWLGFALALTCLAGAVGAGELSKALETMATGPLLMIKADNALGSAVLELSASGLSIENDTLRWSVTDPTVLRDARSGLEIAVVHEVSVAYVADPVVTVNFVVSSAVPTTFTVTSASLGFQTLDGAFGRATAAITVTDVNGGGAVLSGLNADGQVFQAYFNDVGAVAASGSTFATLVGEPAPVAAYASDTVVEDFPAAPGLSVSTEDGVTLGTVSSMSTQFWFSLGAGDMASGTSTFVIQAPVLLTVHAENAEGSATVSVPMSAVRRVGSSSTWSRGDAWTLRDPATGVAIGTVESGSKVVLADHTLNLGFVVTSAEGPTVFTITSANLGFPAVAGAFGRASVAITVTDSNGDGVGIDGDNIDDQVFQAFYNDVGNVPASGASFATLLDSMATGTGYTSVAASAELGAGGVFSATDESGVSLGSVSSMSAQFSFVLGSGGSASGTSVFALHAGGALIGHVFNDVDGDGTLDAGEPGLAGIDVLITDSQAGLRTVTTDGNGDFSVALPAGSTTVDVDDATLPAGAVLTAGTDPAVVDVVEGDETAVPAFGYHFASAETLAIPVLGPLGVLLLILGVGLLGVLRLRA